MDNNQSKTILVVEDEIPLLDAVKRKLENNNMKVITARTVNQALSYLHDVIKVDAIWLDHYLLGKEDGLDLVMTIKKESSLWKHIPVFVVSNTASDQKVKAYLQLGVSKYFVKSNLRLDEIVEELKKAISEQLQ
jgi:DNA-binding response OmpR family regulator